MHYLSKHPPFSKTQTGAMVPLNWGGGWVSLAEKRTTKRHRKVHIPYIENEILHTLNMRYPT
jgi:hypothetical protein